LLTGAESFAEAGRGCHPVDAGRVVLLGFRAASRAVARDVSFAVQRNFFSALTLGTPVASAVLEALDVQLLHIGDVVRGAPDLARAVDVRPTTLSIGDVD
jgi:hypothetical protein